MSEISAARPASGGRFTFAILLLFLGSGCSALIYEVVWFHLLRLVIGASAISLAVLLTSFMGGMCIGSLLLPRLVSRSRHPLRVYAALEVGIGLCGVGLPLILPQVTQLYTSIVGYGFMSIMLRAVVCIVLLLPPTVMMGATLPAVARWVKSTQVGLSHLGFFYGGNIFGAVIGTLLAGFFLLRVYDTQVATFVAFALNIAVALAAMAMARFASFQPGLDDDGAEAESSAEEKRRSNRTIHIAIALSGLTALGAEVVWTRQLSLLFGATVYTFTLVLAVFLLGLGIGSSAGAAIARFTRRPRLMFGLCQMLLIGAIPFGAWMLVDVLHRWQPMAGRWNDFMLEEMTPRFMYDMARCAAAMLPATLLWGASFPLALAAAGRPGRDPGKLVATLYAANTVGAILGTGLVSLAGIPGLGAQPTQKVLAAIAALAALMVLGFAARSNRPAAKKLQQRAIPAPVRLGWVAIVLGASTFAAIQMIHPTPLGLIAYGRFTENWENWENRAEDDEPVADFLHTAEGINATVAVSRTREDGALNFHVAGKIVASNVPIDMRLQRLLGHLPALLHGEPKSVLIVGCGAGVTAGSFVIHPSIERIVICEIEPEVPGAAAKFFARENHRVVDDPRTEIVYDDARHFMATTKETFDIITSDPIHPWVRGAASMYTVEYFDLVKQRLNPGGVVTQWVPLYETSEAAVKSEVGTFMRAFPGGTIWNSDLEDHGYDTILLGQIGGTLIDIDTLDADIRRNYDLTQSLEDINLNDALDVVGTYVGRGTDLTQWLADAQLNHDKSLRLQYLAGLALDVYLEEDIYKQIVQYRRYPEGLLAITDPSDESVLRRMLIPGQRAGSD